MYHDIQGVVTPIDSVQTPATGIKNWVKQSKPKIWKVKRSKAHRKLEKSRVKHSKGQPDTKSHQSTIPHPQFGQVKGLFECGQAVKALIKVKNFDRRGRGCWYRVYWSDLPLILYNH